MKRKFFSTALILRLACGASFGAQPALTIYNQNFAVVRDTIPLDLKAGVNDVDSPIPPPIWSRIR